MSNPVKRLLSPSTNMAGLSAAAGAIYAATLMIYHVVNHQAAFSVPVAIAAIAAAASLLTRQSVTPVADPRDGNGAPMITAPAPVPEPPQAGPPVTVMTRVAPQPPPPGTY